MKIPVKRLNKLLSDKIIKTIRLIGKICGDRGFSCYLVGGTVRDLILGVPQLDIDLVTEVEISSILKGIPKKYSVKRKESRFGTAKLVFEEGFSIDIAQTRKETYPYPGALPSVEKSNIEEDIKRRDFTINTLLMDIGKENLGKIYDHLGGIKDIEDGVIRVLHDKSFIDDPTRIFRAFRFKERFSLRFAQETKKLLYNAIKISAIKNLTPQRIRKELFLILREKTWGKTVISLSENNILKQLGLKKELKSKTLTMFEKILGGMKKMKGNQEIAKLTLITENESIEDIDNFSRIVGLKRKEKELLCIIRREGKRIFQKLARGENSRAEIFQILHPLPHDGLIYLLGKGNIKVRRNIMLYLDELKEVKTKIGGNDLKKLGIKEGPLYQKILKTVLNKKINGELKTKREEIEFAKYLYKKICNR